MNYWLKWAWWTFLLRRQTGQVVSHHLWFKFSLGILWLRSQNKVLCIFLMYLLIYQAKYLFIIANNARERGWHSVKVTSWIWILTQKEARCYFTSEVSEALKQKKIAPNVSLLQSVMVKYAVQLVLSSSPGFLLPLVSLKPKWGPSVLRSGVCIPLNVSYYGYEPLSAGGEKKTAKDIWNGCLWSSGRSKCEGIRVLSGFKIHPGGGGVGGNSGRLQLSRRGWKRLCKEKLRGR